MARYQRAIPDFFPAKLCVTFSSRISSSHLVTVQQIVDWPGFLIVDLVFPTYLGVRPTPLLSSEAGTLSSSPLLIDFCLSLENLSLTQIDMTHAD